MGKLLHRVWEGTHPSTRILKTCLKFFPKGKNLFDWDHEWNRIWRNKTEEMLLKTVLGKSGIEMVTLNT